MTRTGRRIRIRHASVGLRINNPSKQTDESDLLGHRRYSQCHTWAAYIQLINVLTYNLGFDFRGAKTDGRILRERHRIHVPSQLPIEEAEDNLVAVMCRLAESRTGRGASLAPFKATC